MTLGAALISMWLFGAPECPRAAALEGDPALVRALQQVLVDRGIDSATKKDCQLARIRVEPAGDAGMELALLRGEKSWVRSVAGADAAATLIESWVETELTEPLLAHELPAESRAPLSPDAVEVEVPEQQAEPAPSPRAFAVGASGVLGMAGDRSAWSGFDLRGCVRIAPFCVGARVQYALDLGLAGDAARLEADRTLLDLGATIDLPLLFDRFELTPGLGVGHATVSSLRLVPTGEAEEDSGGLRLRAQVSSSWRFADRWALRLSAALDYAPFAEAELSDTIEAVSKDPVALAGEPAVIGWLGLGLELGGI